jgi:hypothetical protein
MHDLSAWAPLNFGKHFVFRFEVGRVQSESQ